MKFEFDKKSLLADYFQIIDQLCDPQSLSIFILDSDQHLLYLNDQSNTNVLNNLSWFSSDEIRLKIQALSTMKTNSLCWKTWLNERCYEIKAFKIVVDDFAFFIFQVYELNEKNNPSEFIAQINSIADCMPGSIFWKDRDGCYLGCNNFVLEMAGVESKEQIIGKKDSDLFGADYVQKINDIDQKVMMTKEKFIVEETIIKANGDKFIALSHKSPLYNSEGEVVGIVGIAIDISELKKTQLNLERASIERKKMLARLTHFVDDQEHDIRTPLGGVVSGLEFIIPILKTDLDEAIPILEMINQSANEILEYQESLLHDLYEGERGGRTIFSRFSLADVAERVFRANEATAMNKKLAYTLEYDESIPAYLLGDGKKVYQCLLDLLGNALRFTSRGAVSLSVEYLGQSHRDAVVRFSVSDTGRGIPEDKQRDILEAYVKVDPSNRGGDRGRGLGLTRVCRYAKQIGGELRIDSEMGKGSCFKLILPFNISLDQTNAK